MNCELTSTVEPEGISLFCIRNNKKLSLSKWGHQDVFLKSGKKAKLGILNLLIQEEIAVEREDGISVVIPHNTLASMEPWEIKGLGLPDIAPFRLVLETHSTLSSDNFSIRYGFTDPESFPVNYNERNGAIITFNDEIYILPEPLYSIVILLDEYCTCPIKDMDQRFLWWGRVRELLPEDAKLSNFLRTINIVKPEHFTLDFNIKNEDIQIIPRFVFPKESKGEQDTDSNGVENQNILPPIVHQDFISHYFGKPGVKQRYGLSERWYVVLPKTLQSVLNVVRKINDAAVEKKMDFIHNPKSVLRKKLDEILDDDTLEQLFIETPLFLNERVKYLGIWQPKIGLYVKSESGQWLPQDGPPRIVGIPMGGGIYNIDTKVLNDLSIKMEEAHQKGKNEVYFGEDTFPVNSESVNAVKRAAKIFCPLEKPLKSEVQTNNEKAKHFEGLVPIIYDHIEELGISVNSKGKRTCVHEAEPKLAKGIRLHDHQKKGVKWMQNHWLHASSGGLLADDMGLGKTAQTLYFMRWVKLQMDEGCTPLRPFLLVAPTALLKNWIGESQKFLKSPYLGRMLKAQGKKFKLMSDQGWASAAEKLKEYDWVLTTYETLRDKIMAFTSIYWAVAIFDEAQKIKNPKAMITDMAKSIKAEFTLALTGTPVENSTTDLWCIVDGVQPGKLETLKEFSKKYIKKGKSGDDELCALKKKLTSPTELPIMLRRSKEENWKENPLHRQILYKNECLFIFSVNII